MVRGAVAAEDALVDEVLLQTLSKALLRAGQPGDLENAEFLAGLRDIFGGEDLVYCRLYYLCVSYALTAATKTPSS